MFRVFRVQFGPGSVFYYLDRLNCSTFSAISYGDTLDEAAPPKLIETDIEGSKYLLLHVYIYTLPSQV